MLQIRINSDFFDIPDDIQVPIVAQNPLVSDTGFNEIFTYSFSLQATPKNISIYNKYVNSNARISLSFQSHNICSGKVKMKRDSSGISVMIKNDGLDLRQELEMLSFDDIELETIQVYDSEDSPEDKIQAWNDLMNSKLPENEPVNEGSFKFPPIEAYPREEWKVSGENGSAINKGMDLNKWCVNRYQLSTGLYVKNVETIIGKREVTYMVFGDSSSIAGGEYFTINSANNVEKFYVWYQKVPGGGGSPIGTDPMVTGRTGIKVELPWPVISSPDEVRDYTINSIFGATYNQTTFESNHFDFVFISGIPYNAVYIVNKKAGQTEASTLGDLPTPLWAMTTERIGTGLIADSNNNWITTISPALKISTLFKETAKKVNLQVDYSAIEEIPEFEQLLYFSGKVLDERINIEASLLVDDFDYQFNVHGQFLNLNDFKPRNKAIDIFKTLRTLFGISYDFVNNKLVLKNIQINAKTFDVSKFCLPDFKIEEIDVNSLRYSYALGTEGWKYLDFINGTAADKFTDATIGNSQLQATDQEVNYLPMISQNGKPTTLHVPFLAKSKAYNENDWIASETLNVGLFRGNFLIDFTIGSDGINPPAEFTEQRLICYNSNYILSNDVQYYGEFINFAGKFGTCSIYFNDEDSHLSIYAKFMNLVKLYNQSIEKNLALPFHNILEIMKWKQPIHTIQQRNMSFVGIVKELKFTLGKSSISPTTITYLSNKKVAGGDYNADYNVDFNL
jgi:hypothetical protein